MDPLLTILRSVRDPRECNARHRLSDILFIALAATLCGAKTCVDIAAFGQGNEDTLTDWLDLPHGAPSHDTFSRVFRLLDPLELERVLTAFTAALREGLGLPAPGVVALDAKSLRRGYERGRAHVPPLMISLWDSQTRLALAAGRVGLSESADAVDLLRSLDLKGCTLTADALHCHPALAEAVGAAGADYVLALKGNNAPLRQAAEAAFAAAFAAGRAPASCERRETGHGRAERRVAEVVALPARHPARALLPGLSAFGRLQAERAPAGGPPETATRYFALSRRATPERLLDVVRQHWSIENECHWVLDVVFREDEARSRKDHAPENLAVLRRVAHAILSAHPAKDSIAGKIRRAMWSRDFFLSLFTHLR
jgi:predicted transposase YbfD/YdcC